MKSPWRRGLIILISVLIFVTLWVIAILNITSDATIQPELKKWLWSSVSELKIWQLILMFVAAALFARD